MPMGPHFHTLLPEFSLTAGALKAEYLNKEIKKKKMGLLKSCAIPRNSLNAGALQRGSTVFGFDGME